MILMDDDHNEHIHQFKDSRGNVFRLPKARELIPEDLPEAKYIVCYVQFELEAKDQKFTRNRRFLYEALSASTLEQFAKALEKFNLYEECFAFDGLYDLLGGWGIVDFKRDVYIYLPV